MVRKQKGELKVSPEKHNSARSNAQRGARVVMLGLDADRASCLVARAPRLRLLGTTGSRSEGGRRLSPDDCSVLEVE
jgi:hypothetical protein